MTLFFVRKQTVIGPRALATLHVLIGISDVVVVVGRNDQWITTVDRSDAAGQVVHPKRRAELIGTYQIVIRPTGFNE